MRCAPWTGRLRACPSGSDLDAAVDAACELSDDKAVYWVCNPVRPGAHKRNDGDIIARRWLPVDCDPVRAPDTNATDDEKAAGIEMARAVGEFLASQGWADPVWVDSGNGVQLLYRIDLPADALAKQWIKAILHVLGDRLDNDRCIIDRGMSRAPQLCKLPGTWARKGPHSEDRPHRMARLVSVPPTIEVVTAEQIGALAGAGTNPEGVMEHGTTCPAPANGSTNGHHANPWGARATSRTLDSYVRSAIRRECAIVSLTPQGDRNNALNTAAFNLGTMADWPEMLLLPARADLLDAALRAGLGELESRKTIESGWTTGATKGRTRPADKPPLRSRKLSRRLASTPTNG